MSTAESAETVYMDETRAMSDDIQTLADSVYKEFEKIIRDYDENAVKDLMPLIVSILESLDKAVQDKQEYEVDLEMIREDNEQLLTQYEREKQLRKNYEQKYLAFEDLTDEERKKLQGKIESLESIVRLFEIKMKNAQDQISRFEERETENKKEYNKLHERYTDLFKAHIDYREKMKFIGSDKVSHDTLPNRRIVSQAPMSVDPGVTLSTANNPDWFSGRAVVPSLAAAVKSHSAVGEGENVSFAEEAKRQRETREIDMNTDEVNVVERGTGTRHAVKGSMLSDYDSGAFDTELSKSSEADIDASIISSRYRHALAGDFASLQTAECDEIEDYGNPAGSRSMVSVFDELSSQDMDALGQIDDGADIAETEQELDQDSNGSENFYGVSREVENLIQENNELLATKNALNIVKDDLIAKVDQLTSEKEIFREEVHSLEVVRDKLKSRIAELEDDIKKLRDIIEQEKRKASLANEDEDDTPMAQRKRFTRVEMARVLLERNQYKERLMELQEAVRWTEMIRASARDSDLVNKKKGTLWNFFSNLFSAPSSKPPKKSVGLPTVRYNSPNTVLKPVVSHQGSSQGSKSKAFDFLKDDFIAAHEHSTFYVPASDASSVATDKARKAREQERREQQKQASAVTKCDDGRLQAYGWSLPSKFPAHVMTEAATTKSQPLPIPVPIYCRPIMEEEATTKLWCAAAVNVSGGKTRDGGSVVGASVFYSPTSGKVPLSSTAMDEVEKLNQEIEVHEKDVKSTEDTHASSLIWICSSNKEGSEVTVIDANNPADVLENFRVSSSHLLCIASVPGATEDDYEVGVEGSSPSNCPVVQSVQSSSADHESTTKPAQKNIGHITLVHCGIGKTGSGSNGEISQADASFAGDVTNVPVVTADELEKEIVPSDPFSDQVSSTGRNRRHIVRDLESELVRDGVGAVGANKFVSAEVEKSSGVLPTMWLGAQSGSIFVYSAVSNWKRCLHSLRLKDSILSISHVKGRVFVALADGSVAVFRRDSFGLWNFSDYRVVTLSEPQFSVRCSCVVANKLVWFGCQNAIHILNPNTLQIEKTFDAHPRKESLVRQMAWIGDGVWLSIRLDSTLRLYHAYTHEHLQDIDIEPYVSKLLGNSKLGFSFVRISCLMTSCNRLWIGTGNGVILSVPLSETNDPGILTSLIACNSNRQTVTSSGCGRPGGVVRVYSDAKTDSVFPGSFIPYCSIAQAQLSFHGHKDAVKFFVTVPGLPSKGVSGFGAVAVSGSAKEKVVPEAVGEEPKSFSRNLLVVSGGEGYVDFRLGDLNDPNSAPDEVRADVALSKGDFSHLIVWKVSTQARKRCAVPCHFMPENNRYS